MDSLLSQLKEFLELKDKAKLALPGVVFGALLMIAFLPPRPIDWIPVVQSNTSKPPVKMPNELVPGEHIPGFDKNGFLNPYGRFAGQVFSPLRQEPACTIDKYELKQAAQLTEIAGRVSPTNGRPGGSKNSCLEIPKLMQ